MSEEDKTPQELLKDVIWKWGQSLVVTLVLLGAGVFIGYYMWGDASVIRLENKQLEDQVVDLKNQRETLSTRIAREQRDKEVCRKELAEVKKGAGG